MIDKYNKNPTPKGQKVRFTLKYNNLHRGLIKGMIKRMGCVFVLCITFVWSAIGFRISHNNDMNSQADSSIFYEPAQTSFQAILEVTPIKCLSLRISFMSFNLTDDGNTFFFNYHPSITPFINLPISNKFTLHVIPNLKLYYNSFNICRLQIGPGLSYYFNRKLKLSFDATWASIILNSGESYIAGEIVVSTSIENGLAVFYNF